MGNYNEALKQIETQIEIGAESIYAHIYHALAHKGLGNNKQEERCVVDGS